MSNCEFTYNLGSLAPIVQEYKKSLTWYQQQIQTQDEFGLFFSIHIKVNYDRDLIRTEHRSVALHVTNRYIQSEIAINFRIWTAYDISALIEDDPNLEIPEEYYDDIVWDASVDGFGGGTQYSDEASSGVAMTFIIIIIGIIALVGVYVVVKFGKTWMIFKMGQASAKKKR